MAVSTDRAAVDGSLDVTAASALSGEVVLASVGSGSAGLSGAEATRRVGVVGPNAVRSHRARAWPVRPPGSAPAG